VSKAQAQIKHATEDRALCNRSLQAVLTTMPTPCPFCWHQFDFPIHSPNHQLSHQFLTALSPLSWGVPTVGP
jgi:hypothetical protein